MDYTLEEKEVFMREALKEAEIALEHDESPLVVSLLRTDKLLVVGIMLVRSCNGQSCMRKLWP